MTVTLAVWAVIVGMIVLAAAGFMAGWLMGYNRGNARYR
jgi:uncharacterized membrane protein